MAPGASPAATPTTRAGSVLRPKQQPSAAPRALPNKNGTLTTDQRWQFRTQPPWLGHGDFMFDEGLTNKNQSWQVENPRGLAMEVFPFAGKIIYRWWIFQQATPLITGGFSGLTDKHWHRTQNMAFSPTQRGFLLLQNMMILLTRKGYWASSCKVVFS